MTDGTAELNGMSLRGRTALVTGGAGGIGARICRDLADLGARVVVADADEPAARAVADRLPDGVAVGGDLADLAAVDRMLGDAVDRAGPVDIVVNNAGITAVERFVDSDPASWDRQWRVNLRAPMQIVHRVLGGMMERRWGRLVFISSDGARAGSAGEGVYSACKAGLMGFAKTIAREAARAEVTSNVVCPGPIDTPMTRGVTAQNPKLVETLVRSIPLRRLGRPEDVAGLVAFLCTDRAGYVTGQTLSVSGGITMA
ncbi:MAG TPA: SDR family NAD(P)-dependent oxidoreductase [Acidimicrobiales bacterium]